jgi:hypothetical protein
VGVNLQFFKVNSLINQIFAEPQAIRNLSVFCKNESALWIKWQAPYPPTGNVSFYITLKDGETSQNSSSNSSCELWDDFTCATFTELKKETNYTIIVNDTKRL